MHVYISKADLHRQICRNIRMYRIQAGLTQDKLSEKVDISHDYLRQLESEKGQKYFSFYTLYKISLVLKVSLDELASGSQIRTT